MLAAQVRKVPDARFNVKEISSVELAGSAGECIRRWSVEAEEVSASIAAGRVKTTGLKCPKGACAAWASQVVDAADSEVVDGTASTYSSLTPLLMPEI